MGRQRRLKDSQILVFQKRLTNTFRKLGVPKDEIEEATQDVFVKWLRGRSQHQTVEQAAIDWCRKNYGSDTRNRKRQKAARSPHSSAPEVVNRLPAENKIDFDMMAVRKILTRVKDPVTRIVMKLILQWGFSQAEVAELFDMTQAAITFRVQDAVREMRRSYERPTRC